MLDKKDFENSFLELLENIHPKKLIKNQCKYENNTFFINDEVFTIPKDKKVYLFASGKAAISMADGIYEILDNKIKSSVLVSPYENDLVKESLTYVKSTHPLPSFKSIEASNALIKSFESLEEDDIFIYLLSGGNSALVELPEEGISLDDFQKTTHLMLQNSMPIEAINCVRKHISKVKGGKLATYTKAKGVVLTLSDVLGDDFEAIGSAPLYYDKTTFDDAICYLEKFELFSKLPSSVQKHLTDGKNGLVDENPKNENPNIKHYLIGSNDILLKAAKKVLEQKGLNPIVVDEKIDDDVEVVCKNLIDFSNSHENGCFIFGGEATVSVKGNGKGGRNQHLVISFLNSFPKDKEMIFLSGASDGIDGNSDASGAIIDSLTLQKVRDLGLDLKAYKENFDSNSFFDKLNQLLKPGPTHNNMLDIVIININSKNKKEI